MSESGRWKGNYLEIFDDKTVPKKLFAEKKLSKRKRVLILPSIC